MLYLEHKSVLALDSPPTVLLLIRR